MKALFVCDNVFVRDGEVIYSEGQFGFSSWERYLEKFCELTVLARVRAAFRDEDKDRLNVSSGKNVNFVFAPTMSGVTSKFINSRAVNKIVRHAISDSDVVIIRLPSQLGIVASKMARSLRKPYCIEVVGCGFNGLWWHGSIKAKIFAPIMWFSMRKAVAQCESVLYVTNNYLQRRYETSGYTGIASNVQLPLLDVSVIENRLRRIEGAGRCISIGFIGTLHTKYKGLDTLFRAIRHLSKSGCPVTLYVVGNGEQQPWRTLAEKYNIHTQVVFCGMLKSGNQVYKWLDQIDIYVQPSLTEGLPRTVIEAMSRGCPVVASNVGGIPELIECECLHKPKDYKSLSKLLRQLITDKRFMALQVRCNFNKALNYQSHVLDGKRREFFERLKNLVLYGKELR